MGKFFEWLDERKIFGILIIAGDISLMHVLMLDSKELPQPIIELLSAGVGSLSTAVAVIAQSLWREGQTDKQNAATMASLAASVSGSSDPTPQK